MPWRQQQLARLRVQLAVLLVALLAAVPQAAVEQLRCPSCLASNALELHPDCPSRRVPCNLESLTQWPPGHSVAVYFHTLSPRQHQTTKPIKAMKRAGGVSGMVTCLDPGGDFRFDEASP